MEKVFLVCLSNELKSPISVKRSIESIEIVTSVPTNVLSVSSMLRRKYPDVEFKFIQDTDLMSSRDIIILSEKYKNITFVKNITDKAEKVVVSLRVTVETSKSLEVIQQCIKTGIMRNLDSPPYYCAQPNNIKIEIV